MKSKENIPEFNELVFEGRNKEYGAYILRKLYNKYVSISATGAMIIFALIVSYPLITASIFPVEHSKDYSGKDSTIIILTIPPIEKPDADIPLPIQPKTPTVKYIAPVVRPDEQVFNEYIPTVEDLINKNPGTETVEGNIYGTDIIDGVKEIEIPEVEQPKEQVHLWAEEMPEFPGGDSEMLNYFAKNISYPEIAIRAQVEGKVVLTFIVDKNGEIRDVSVAKSIGAGCDEEAMRVLKSMPRWIPGKQNGKPVITKINIPVVFKLN